MSPASQPPAKYINREELRSYENSLKYYRDLKNSMDTARYEGREEGIAEGIEIGRETGIDLGIQAVALALLKEGVSDDIILKTTQLTPEQLQKLRQES
ncbi:MAG: hypothetical protein F6J87_20870 [Spirulina sp. SIO3F2]|nr:hypothetical protein [Spirulina sp. SIO3F2]